MLRSLALLVLLAVLPLVGHAENRTQTFTFYYNVLGNNYHDASHNGFLAACQQHKQTNCEARADQFTNKLLAYMTYRFTTEFPLPENTATSNHTLDCLLARQPQTACADVQKYYESVRDDFIHVMEFEQKINTTAGQK
jgi:hypothetical protein